jgi:perosamine synthetase
MEIKSWPQPIKPICAIAQPNLTIHERSSLLKSFDSTWIGSNSELIEKAEEAFLKVLNFPKQFSSVLVSNGSLALTLALEALGIGQGDEVIVPSITYAACASTVVNQGATPVFCDVELDSWQLSLNTTKNMITEKTRAIILCHTYGVATDYFEIITWAKSIGIFVIEDCSEALGGVVRDNPVGVQGDIATFSFFPNKLITSGEGGMCVTKNSEFLSTMKLLRGQGMSPTSKYWFLRSGFNFRITGLQASILLAQLDRFQELFHLRKKSEDRWSQILAELVNRPIVSDDCIRAPWLFSCIIPELTLQKKLKLADQLAKIGIETRPVFYPLELMPAFKKYQSSKNLNAQSISTRGITLPTGYHVQKNIYRVVLQHIKESLIATD